MGVGVADMAPGGYAVTGRATKPPVHTPLMGTPVKPPGLPGAGGLHVPLLNTTADSSGVADAVLSVTVAGSPERLLSAMHVPSRTAVLKTSGLLQSLPTTNTAFALLHGALVMRTYWVKTALNVHVVVASMLATGAPWHVEDPLHSPSVAVTPCVHCVMA